MEINTSNSTTPEKETPARNWIQRLKEESWEAELLVSTVSIFGTFQLFKLISWWTNVLIDLLDPSQYLIGYFIVYMGLLGVSILTTMFIIHFFLRAYWIGLVGLNSVFPDYSLEGSIYSKTYTEKMMALLPSLRDSIQKVDELCSVIFSAAFTFLLMYVYLAFIASLYLFIFNMLVDRIPAIVLLLPVIAAGIIVFVQTLLSAIANLKAFKEHQKIQGAYFQSVKLSSILIFGPLYKNIMQIMMIFGSNFKNQKSMIRLMLVFIFFGVIASVYAIKQTNIPYLIYQNKYFKTTHVYSSYYQTENSGNNFLLSPEINSDIINEGVTSLFIPIFLHEQSFAKKICGTYSDDPQLSQKINKEKKDDHRLACYHRYHQVYLNDQIVEIHYRRYEHPRTGQIGILGYLNLSDLATGINTLQVKKQFQDQRWSEWSIPFYYYPKME